jgi:N6-adenosine-specific RNA methylase IME4
MGFTPKSEMMWDKQRTGTGFWFRNQHEVLLVATRGRPPCPAHGENYPSILREKALGHSIKPEGVYQMIEALYPSTPKLELFARQWRDGWEAEGDELPSRPAR